jgi:hypothetical protein
VTDTDESESADPGAWAPAPPTPGLEAFREWLLIHDAHGVLLCLGPDPPEVARATSDGPTWRRKYLLEKRCDASCMAPERERLRTCDTIAVTSSTDDEMLERWDRVVRHDSADAFRLPGILDLNEPFMSELLAFPFTHRSHSIIAELAENDAP